MPTKSEKSGGTRREAEALLREMVRDSVAAARESWRMANRIGRAGLRWAEKTADEIVEELG